MNQIEPLHSLHDASFESEFGAIPAIDLQSVQVGALHDPILQDIDLSVRERDCFAVIGPCGGGKTTLLRAILGLTPVLSGEIQLFGSHPSARIRRRLPIGYLPQFSPIPHDAPATVWDYVCMGVMGARGFFRPLRREQSLNIESLLSALHLDHHLKDPAGSLTPGRQQRVRIARALSAMPKLLLMDDPFHSMDPAGRESVIRLLTDLQDRFKTTIFITAQDGGPLAPICRHVACLNHSVLWVAGRRRIHHDVWSDPCRNFPSKDGDRSKKDRSRFPGHASKRTRTLPNSHSIQFWR
ncbi:MAG: ATP-binding cassette domain-containing protein [Candidatus Omnitrophica bacterium]|nr:ATP-binding cassette domain-containing protein [Candidatus Omnitrophota bacterium]